MTSSEDGFLRRLVARFDELKIVYCLLAGADDTGDIDFMVDEPHRNSIGLIIAQVARPFGGRLVQAIAHETSACFYIVALPTATGSAYLQLDCYGDYRRQSRLWLEAAPILAQRRPVGDFYAPRVQDEFAYYLIKKVLKQQVEEAQLRRLRNLFCADPFACDDELRRSWSADTAALLKRLLLRLDLDGFRGQMPNLRRLLLSNGPKGSSGERTLHRLRDWLRILQRILRPTGLNVAIMADGQAQRAFCAELMNTLVPAFRKGCIEELTTDNVSICLAWKLFLARRRSILSIITATSSRGTDSRSPRLASTIWNIFRDSLWRMLVDLQIEFRPSPDSRTFEEVALREPEENARTKCLVLCCASSQENVRRAANAILDHLEKRTNERLNLHSLVKGLRKPAHDSALEQPAGGD